MAEAKVLLKLTIETTPSWDGEMPLELRNKWLKQFLRWESLKGMQFERPVMPQDAVNSEMRIILKGDFSKQILDVGCWGGFKKKDGTWSSQHILSRHLLAKEKTIPKGELQALCNASNMGWIIRKILAEWVVEYIVVGGSVIALCWTSTEKKSLAMFHRNRVIQIRRGTDLDKLYHVITSEN